MQEALLKQSGGFDEVLAKILQFIHTIADWIGGLIATVIHSILPSVTIPDDLIQSIGLMAILTIFLLIMQIAKKLTWIVVVVGWVLIMARIAMIVIKG
ncbi:MAG: hypothetical protein P8Y09_11565 [Deltaproteobacteria bacterium]|jgi:hypothetical protein